MSEAYRQTALALAQRLELLEVCETCGATWNRAELDLEDGETLDALVESAADLIDDRRHRAPRLRADGRVRHALICRPPSSAQLTL